MHHLNRNNSRPYPFPFSLFDIQCISLQLHASTETFKTKERCEHNRPSFILYNIVQQNKRVQILKLLCSFKEVVSLNSRTFSMIFLLICFLGANESWRQDQGF